MNSVQIAAYLLDPRLRMSDEESYQLSLSLEQKYDPVPLSKTAANGAARSAGSAAAAAAKAGRQKNSTSRTGSAASRGSAGTAGALLPATAAIGSSRCSAAATDPLS